MSRAVKNVRSAGASAQKQPSAANPGNGTGVTKRTGLERPQPSTDNPQDMADPTARVIQTRTS